MKFPKKLFSQMDPDRGNHENFMTAKNFQSCGIMFITRFGKQPLVRYSHWRESHGTQNRYAVAVKKDGTVITHLLRKVLCVCLN